MEASAFTDFFRHTQSTNSTSTNSTMNPNLLIGLINPNILYYILIVNVSCLVLTPIIIAIITKMIKPINSFVRSYNRILTSMISDSIYELQFFQTIACFSFLNVGFEIEAKETFLSLRRFVFLDYYDQYTYSADKAQGLPATIMPYFTNSFFDNSKTFVILFIFGSVVAVLILIKDAFVYLFTRKGSTREIIIDDNKDNKNFDVKILQDKGNDMIRSSDVDNDKQIIFKTLRKQKFKKCSFSATSQYFLFNYFIRLYQVTMMKVTFVCLLVITNSNLDTSNRLDVIFAYVVLFLWLILFPISLFIYLRNKAIDLMSPNMIVRFGALYLTYRGISKDVYAFLIQLKFAALPIICVFFLNFPAIQIISVVILYFFNILFTTIYMPFFKVSKVFIEAISEGVLMGFCILILILNLVPSLQTSPIPRYILFFMIMLLLLIRTYRIIYDTIFRIKNLKNIKPPMIYGIDIPYELKGKDHFENEKKKKRDKKLMKYNNYELRIGRNVSSYDNKKSINFISQGSPLKENNKEKTHSNITNNLSDVSQRKLLTGSNKDDSAISNDRRNNESRNDDVKEEIIFAPLKFLHSSEGNQDSNEAYDEEVTIEIGDQNIERKNSNYINPIMPINQSGTKHYQKKPLSQEAKKPQASQAEKTNTKLSTKIEKIPKNNQPANTGDNDINSKKSFPTYKEISNRKIDINSSMNSSVKQKNNSLSYSNLNISKEISPINGDKTEDMILVSFLNGSHLSNFKSMRDTKEIERKYEEEFANISDNFKKNIILPDANILENEVLKKKSFDLVSKISKTGSSKDTRGNVKSIQKISNLEEIKEENIKSHNNTERDLE